MSDRSPIDEVLPPAGEIFRPDDYSTEIEVLGATIDARRDGRAHVLAWRDEITPRDPAARELAATVGIDA